MVPWPAAVASWPSLCVAGGADARRVLLSDRAAGARPRRRPGADARLTLRSERAADTRPRQHAFRSERAAGARPHRRGAAPTYASRSAPSMRPAPVRADALRSKRAASSHPRSTVQMLNKLATFNILKCVRRHCTAAVPPSCLPACQDPPPYPSLLHFATSLQHFKKNEYFD